LHDCAKQRHEPVISSTVSDGIRRAGVQRIRAALGLPGTIARKNEHLKLLATWINNFSLAFAASGFVVPLVGTRIPGGGPAIVVFFWLLLAIAVLDTGQYVLEGIR
jgi:hypothetical protein